MVLALTPMEMAEPMTKRKSVVQIPLIQIPMMMVLSMHKRNGGDTEPPQTTIPVNQYNEEDESPAKTGCNHSPMPAWCISFLGIFARRR